MNEVKGLVMELIDAADCHGDIEQSTAVGIAGRYEADWQSERQSERQSHVALVESLRELAKKLDEHGNHYETPDTVHAACAYHSSAAFLRELLPPEGKQS